MSFGTGSKKRSIGEDITWTFTYNGLHQLVERKQHSALYPAALTQAAKWHYTYDMSGNLAEATKENESAVQTERWLYEWNPRDQLIRAEKRTGTGSGTYAGKVEYEYCLSCDGALSARIEYNPSWTVVSHRRYEYDGLNLVRIDERYDVDTPPDGIDAGDPWRTLEVSTHRPGALGALLSKRVFTHNDNNDAADATDDYVYVYDPVGNVWVILASDGHELYNFTQDAFGNELTISPFNGTSWNTARTAGITEHQTGKWLDPFTGLYYFSARWYDSGAGRFVGRDKIEWFQYYMFVSNRPTDVADPTGLTPCGTVPGVWTKRLDFDLLAGQYGHQWLVFPGWPGSIGVYPRVEKPTIGVFEAPDRRGNGPCNWKWPSKNKCFGKLWDLGKPYLERVNCKDATCGQITSCLQSYSSWLAGVETTYIFPFIQCRSYTENILGACCMKSGSVQTGEKPVPSPPTPSDFCLSY